MQDVEMLKQMLARIKVHIPTKSLERGIIMPRDLDNYHPALPKIGEMIMINPNKDKKDDKKKKKKVVGNKEGMMRAAGAPGGPTVKALEFGGPLLPNKKDEYRPYEFGNYPLKTNQKGDFIPRAGVYRMLLPECADWTDKAE